MWRLLIPRHRSQFAGKGCASIEHSSLPEHAPNGILVGRLLTTPTTGTTGGRWLHRLLHFEAYALSRLKRLLFLVERDGAGSLGAHAIQKETQLVRDEVSDGVKSALTYWRCLKLN